MTKPANRQSAITARRQGALARMEKNHDDYPLVDKEMATLQERIDSAPNDVVHTKKNRSDRAKSREK